MCPHPSLIHSHVLRSICHLDTFLLRGLLTAGTTEAVQTCFFERQNRESATLAFPGLVYKRGNQEGGYYPDAHMQRTATKRHTRPESLTQDSSSVAASDPLMSDMKQTPGSTDLNSDGALGPGIITKPS